MKASILIELLQALTNDGDKEVEVIATEVRNCKMSDVSRLYSNIIVRAAWRDYGNPSEKIELKKVVQIVCPEAL